MKNLKNLNSFSPKKSNAGTMVALAAGGVILSGLAASLFLTESGQRIRKRLVAAGKNLFDRSKRDAAKSRTKLGQVVSDVRDHVRLNAESLLGSEQQQAEAAKIHPAQTPSTAWKNPTSKKVYPENTIPVN